MSELTGRTVSHYRIQEKLGGGGMGVVYRARDERLDRDVALKVLSPGTLADETARSRFRREALTLSQLNHPNIAVVHDFDSDDGVDFLAMEYVAGETLAAKLTAGPLAEGEVVRLGTQIAEALEEAHERDVIHRDLKPGNVMVTPKGRVKVLDFGLAKLVRPMEIDGATASLAETQAGTVMGTMPYMAPEQLQGKRVDARADLYALGAVLYEMATGQRPFPEKQPTQLIAAILTEPPQPPRHLNGQVSPGLESIILKALEKDPVRRYPSAKDLLADLSELSLTGSIGVARRPGLRRRWALGALAAAGLALVALLLGLNVGKLRERLSGRGGPPHIESIAVLPLENLSADADQEYLADGMTDELTTDLAKISALRVISRTSVMHYKRSNKTVPEIARELHVDAVVEGSVVRSGNRVRVSAQLVEASTDQHLWAESYERELRDLLAIEDEVARDIAGQIHAKITPTEKTLLASARPIIPQAYEAYLKGRFFENTRTDPGIDASIQYLKQAIALDPNYAPAYAALADTLGLKFQLPTEQRRSQAKALAQKALEMDETLAFAHVVMGRIAMWYDWDWAAAEKHLKRALELDPSLADAHYAYARYLEALGRMEEALAEIGKAQELDPFSAPIRWARADLLYDVRRYAEALDQNRKVLELDPSYPYVPGSMAMILFQQHRYAEAVAEWQKDAELSGDEREAEALGRAYAKSGVRGVWLERADYATSLRQRGSSISYDLAQLYVHLGRNNDALKWLEKAYSERSLGLVHLKVDPELDPLRAEPRFQDLLRRMNFPP